MYTLLKTVNNCKVRYCQKSNLLPDFIIRFVGDRIHSDISVIANVSFSEEFIGDKNIFEIIHSRLTNIVNSWADRIEKENCVFSSVIEAMGYNQYKVRAYIENKAYWSLYRSVEVIVVVEKLSHESALLILKRGWLSHLLTPKKGNKIHWYSNIFSKYFRLSKREGYHYDEMNSTEFKRGDYSTLHTYISIGYYFVKTLLLSFCKEKDNKIRLNSRNTIGVDQYQMFLRERSANDLMWFDSGFVNPESVVYIANTRIDDESLQFLHRRKIPLIRVNPSIVEIFKSIICNKGINNYIVPKLSFYRKVIEYLFKKSNTPILDNESRWIFQLLKHYVLRELYWRNVYSQLDIKLLWSMADGCQDSLIRAQSIEKNNGLYSGSNYSFYQFDSVHSQKMYDVFFAWGDYFSNKIMQRNHTKNSIFVNVGYVSDSHFSQAEKVAIDIKKKFRKKYIVSYIDNNTGYDLELSRYMSFDMMRMLLELLDKYDYMTLFLKPKRQLEIDAIIERFPKFSKFVDSGRIVIFIGKKHGERYPPAIIGKSSNLVVCLGINTAGIECFLNGANVVYANLSKFQGSKFYKDGRGKIVFNSIDELKDLVEERVKNRKIVDLSEERGIYSDLDSFQDGQSHRRVGRCISIIQHEISNCHDRPSTIKRIRNALGKKIEVGNMI